MTAATVLALCLAIQGGPLLPLYALPPPHQIGMEQISGAVPLQAFRLQWLHSVEKLPWEEQWAVTPQGLRLGQVRISGSGAGMEPPPEARLVNGRYEYSGADRPAVPQLVLPDSDFTGPVHLCREDGSDCLPLHILAGRGPHDRKPLILSPCVAP